MCPVRKPNYPNLRNRDFSGEYVLNATRSSGPGGQNVNKVSTRVELRFPVSSSNLLTKREKALVLKKLESIVTKEGYLVFTSQSARTQYKNRENVIEKFHRTLNKALTIPKKRIPTRATTSSKEKRLGEKKIHAETKSLRKKITDN